MHRLRPFRAAVVATASFPPVHTSPQRPQICPTARTRKPGEGNLPPRRKSVWPDHPASLVLALVDTILSDSRSVPSLSPFSGGDPVDSRAKRASMQEKASSPLVAAGMLFRLVSGSFPRKIGDLLPGVNAPGVSTGKAPFPSQRGPGGERSAGSLQKGPKNAFWRLTPTNLSPMPSAWLLGLFLARESASRTHHSDTPDNQMRVRDFPEQPQGQGQELASSCCHRFTTGNRNSIRTDPGGAQADQDA